MSKSLIIDNYLTGIRMTRHGREQVDAHRWRGLAVLGIDGTTLRVVTRIARISRCLQVVDTVRVRIRKQGSLV